jgi:hypothetical protein
VKKIVKLLDRYMSYIVILRDRACVVCGKSKGLQAGHYFKRGHYSARWSTLNVMAQCGGCNILHNENPEPLRRALARRIRRAKLAEDVDEIISALEFEWRAPLDKSRLPKIQMELEMELAFWMDQYGIAGGSALNKKIVSCRATNREVERWMKGVTPKDSQK